MAKVIDHISSIRARFRGTSDDDNWTDPLIYKYMNDVRALLVKRELDKKGSLGEGIYQVICIPLEEEQFYDCSCVPTDDCLVMKSVCELPQVIKTKYRPMITIFDGNRSIIPYVDMTRLRGRAQLDTDPIYWTVINNHLVLFGAKRKVVFARAMWADPSEIEFYCDCGPEDPETPCIDYEIEDYPIEQHMVLAMEDMVIERIYPSFKVPDDINNDAKER